MKKTLLSLIIITFIFILYPAYSSRANLITPDKKQDFTSNITNAATSSYDTNRDLNSTLAKVIQLVLSVLGMIFLVLMFLAGNDWMQAAGNEEKVKKSQEVIRNLLIGLVIVLVAYAMSSGFSTVLKTLVK
ncbi:MAG: hypothetical protein WC863_03605 [Patescibacteria group bacterium]